MAVTLSSSSSVGRQGFLKYSDDFTASRAISKVFKEWYIPGVRDLLNNETIGLKTFNRNVKSFGGKYAVIAVRTGRNNGIGAFGEVGSLPDPMSQKYENLQYELKRLAGRIAFTGQAVADSKNDMGAFLQIADAEMRGLSADRVWEDSRICYGDGTGRLCRISDVTAAPVYKVDRPGGFTQNLGSGTQYLRVGMRVAMVAPGAYPTTVFRQEATANRKVFYIRSVNHSTGEITFAAEGDTTASPARTVSGGGGATVGDFLVTANNVPAATVDPALGDIGLLNEPFGAAAIVGNGNPDPAYTSGKTNYIGELDAVANSVWQANIVDNGGTPMPFSKDLIQQAIDNVRQVAGTSIKVLLTTYGIRRQFLNWAETNKRFVNTTRYEGGFEALEYQGMTLIPDHMMTRGRIYGLDTDAIFKFENTPYQWMDDDGSVLSRVPDKWAFEAALVGMHQYGTDARNRHCGIFDIQDA